MKNRLRRALSWALALGALSFVIWAVPLRDRCWDSRVPRSTRVAVSRDASGCVLHLQTGEVRIDSTECSQLTCEPGLLSTMARARPGVVVALLAVYALGTLAWAGRWRALLGFAGVDLSLGQVWRLSLEAQAGGVLLPGGIGGDALRVASVVARPTRPGEPRAPLTIVVASVLLDRIIGLSLIAGLAAALGFALGGLQAGPFAAAPAALAGIPLCAAVGLVVLVRIPLERIGWLAKGAVGRVVTPVLAYVRDPRAPRAIAVAVALSAVVAAIQFVVIRGLLFAIGVAPSQEKWVYVGTAMAFIVSAIPALPGAVGTAEAAYVVFFGLGGVAAGAALGVCLMFRLFWYISAVVGAVLHVVGSRVPATSVSRGPASKL